MPTRVRLTTILFLAATLCSVTQLKAQQQQVVVEQSAGPLTVQTQGQVHEAFASGEVYYHDAPPPAPKMPPAEIVEVKPAIPAEFEKRAIWIPGYWEFDETRGGFTWVSGVWRFPPPNHRWVAGKWVRTDEGFVRQTGYWLPRTLEQVAYLKAPPRYQGSFPLPETLAKEHYWVPGCWLPVEGGEFEWRKGFVAPRAENWVWVPARYHWAAQGWIFVDGYWDYPLNARGQSFASLQLVDGTYKADQLRIEKFAPVPSTALRETTTGDYVYTVDAFDEEFQFVSTQVESYVVPEIPVATSVVIAAQPSATLQGVVRRGTLTPARIEVELLGHSIPVATTDDQGRFQFSDVPYGVYYIRASGPVQNHVRRAYGKVVVGEPVIDVELELD